MNTTTVKITIAVVFGLTAILVAGTNNVFAQEGKFAIQGTQKSMQDPLPGQ